MATHEDEYAGLTREQSQAVKAREAGLEASIKRLENATPMNARPDPGYSDALSSQDAALSVQTEHTKALREKSERLAHELAGTSRYAGEDYSSVGEEKRAARGLEYIRNERAGNAASNSATYGSNLSFQGRSGLKLREEMDRDAREKGLPTLAEMKQSYEDGIRTGASGGIGASRAADNAKHAQKASHESKERTESRIARRERKKQDFEDTIAQAITFDEDGVAIVNHAKEIKNVDITQEADGSLRIRDTTGRYVSEKIDLVALAEKRSTEFKGIVKHESHKGIQQPDGKETFFAFASQEQEKAGDKSFMQTLRDTLKGAYNKVEGMMDKLVAMRNEALKKFDADGNGSLDLQETTALKQQFVLENGARTEREANAMVRQAERLYASLDQAELARASNAIKNLNAAATHVPDENSNKLSPSAVNVEVARNQQNGVARP